MRKISLLILDMILVQKGSIATISWLLVSTKSDKLGLKALIYRIWFHEVGGQLPSLVRRKPIVWLSRLVYWNKTRIIIKYIKGLYCIVFLLFYFGDTLHLSYSHSNLQKNPLMWRHRTVQLKLSTMRRVWEFWIKVKKIDKEK